MIEDILVCYRILELEPGASLAEVKRSYRDLVRVWHPDRFPNDPKLQRKGEDKLKQINSAYDRICKSDSAPPSKTPKPADASGPQPMKGANASSGQSSQDHQNSSRQEAPNPAPRSNPKSPEHSKTNLGERLMQIAAAVVVILIIRAVFSTNAGTRKQTEVYSPPVTKQHLEPSATFAPATPSSQQSISKNTPESPSPSIPAIPTNRKLKSVADSADDLKSNATSIVSLKTPKPWLKSNGRDDAYFTVGSTRDEVLAVQGTPDKFTDTILSYGSSDVYFANGRVVSWIRYSMSPLKAQLLPKNPVEAKAFFTVGSTKDEVLAVQGTPDKFTDTSFSYGSSDIHFSNGRVLSWTQYSMSPLKVRLLPLTPAAEKAFFTVGSTKDEVLSVQGTPDKFTDTSFSYGSSDIHFSNGRVLSWTQYSMSPLKARLLPSTPVAEKAFFTVGSTKDEVLSVQGTPDKFTETSFSYGSSDVFFSNGRVVSWTRYAMSPLKVK